MKRYTAAELAFVKRRRKMPRCELVRAFRRKFRRREMTLLRLQDLCNRKGWGVGSLKGRRKGVSRTFNRTELAFLSRRRRMARRDLHAAFVKKFKRSDVRRESIKQLCTRNGWRADRNWRRIRTKGRTKYSKAELAFLRRRQTMPRRDLHAAYVKTFRREISLKAFKQLCKRFGFRTGRTGQFAKGLVPANKGKKVPYNANSARTQFKKGGLPPNTKYLGHERVSKDGYVEISIAETNPHTGFGRRYVLKHRWLWEQAHGPVPADMVLKTKTDRLNCDPSNWELVPRGLLPWLNGKSGRNYDAAPEHLKPIIMAVAKLEHRLREKSRAA